MVVGGKHHTPATIHPLGKGPPVPTGEGGWGSELVWTQRLKEKPYAPTGDRTPAVQSVVRYYTD
jgi:hypothetical protein